MISYSLNNSWFSNWYYYFYSTAWNRKRQGIFPSRNDFRVTALKAATRIYMITLHNSNFLSILLTG